MKQESLGRLAPLALAFFLAGWANVASAEPRHGIAMYGEPALPPDFVSLPYANPDAPKGGAIVFGESGGFDSLNPFIIKGTAPAAVSQLTVETLLGRSYDEPFSLYGLLAESVDTDAARSYVAFTLREGARFSDNSPVTIDDVLWSFETLGTQGNPRYAEAWGKIASATQTGPRSVRFTFTEANRELPLILGLRPILQKAQWQGRDFTASGLTAPIGSGPYVVETALPGKTLTLRKNPNWWGVDLPFNRGLHNLDEIRYEYFAGAGVMFEAFRGGETTAFLENNPAKWQVNYDYPAVQAGKIVKAEIPHGRPSGIEGFAFNTRRPMFADWRVREALILAFNFEQTNATLNANALPRIASYFSNTELGAGADQPATGRVLDLLTPFQADLPPGTIEGYALPRSDGTLANRKNLRRANALLEEAGFSVQNGVLSDAAGAPFVFEILLANGSDQLIATASIYIEALKRLGITASITTVDTAVYRERTNAYDFDMTHYIRSLTLSPGNEQRNYWGTAAAGQPGSRNWMGVHQPAVDALITEMLTVTARADYVAAVQALDRVLIAGRYVVPIWYSDKTRLAYDARLHYAENLPLYGVWPGFLPEVWWYQE